MNCELMHLSYAAVILNVTHTNDEIYTFLTTNIQMKTCNYY